MQLNNKQRRETRRKNHIAKDLRSPKYQQRVVKDKRSHKVDELHERESIEQLFEYFDAGLDSKE